MVNIWELIFCHQYINASRDTFTVDKNSIRFGLAAVKNVGENALKNDCRYPRERWSI